MFRLFTGTCKLVSCIGLMLIGQTAQAAIAYDFRQLGTGDVLATLELSSLPATHTEVLGLSFTAEGDAFFGLGVGLFWGTFITDTGSFISDGSDGLMSSIVSPAHIFTDIRPNGLAPGIDFFEMRAGSLSSGVNDPLAQDQMSLNFPAGAPHSAFQAFGEWRLHQESVPGTVPEPASLLVWCGIGLLIVGWKKSRKSDRRRT